MKLFEDNPGLKTFPVRYIVYAIAALLLIIINVLGLDLIQIGGITPDLVLILCVWIALAEGRFKGLFAAFAIGFLFDLITADVIGTNALAKVIGAFVAGSFFKENAEAKNFGFVRFTLINLLVATIHNSVYYFFYVKAGDMSFGMFFLKYGVAASFYTSVFAAIAALSKIPKKVINID